MLREDFLQQDAFVDVDNYSSYERQAKLLWLILQYDKLCRASLTRGASIERLLNIEAKDLVGRAKSIPADEYESAYDEIFAAIDAQIKEAESQED